MGRANKSHNATKLGPAALDMLQHRCKYAFTYNLLCFHLTFIQVLNMGTKHCLDSLKHSNKGGEPGLYPCHHQGSNQVCQYSLLYLL